ncbi:MAG: hypothetical protein EOQ41_10635 [Mesorhizobium sp.]|nr:MAG: hypothetical protein EOQ41_10635 [Mesorhizobium sp.]
MTAIVVSVFEYERPKGRRLVMGSFPSTGAETGRTAVGPGAAISELPHIGFSSAKLALGARCSRSVLEKSHKGQTGTWNLGREVEQMRYAGSQNAQETLQVIYNRAVGPADFLFVPVSNGNRTSDSTHCSLLLVDGRNPERVAYHHDSSRTGPQRRACKPARKGAERHLRGSPHDPTAECL